MTIEEIIEFCEMKAELEPENEDIYEAVIKILEQQESEDCISRQEALSHSCIVVDDDGMIYRMVSVNAIQTLPSVTPKMIEPQDKTKQGLAYADQDTLMSAT